MIIAKRLVRHRFPWERTGEGGGGMTKGKKGGYSSVATAPESSSKGRGFEPREERRENF